MAARVKEFLVKSAFLILPIVVVGIFVDIFLFDAHSDLLVLLLTGLWILSARSFRFESRVSIGLALVFLALCPFLLIFGKEAVAEKAAIWAYAFLVVGVLQMISELRKGTDYR